MKVFLVHTKKLVHNHFINKYTIVYKHKVY